MNMKQHAVDIPKPSNIVFQGSIHHPNLWLWDSWVCHFDGTHHLYCLALNRFASDGTAITPADRNFYPFHIRHFTSSNGAKSWKDCGVFMTPDTEQGSASHRNVWSGSVDVLSNSKVLVGYTGLRTVDDDHQFLQTICLGTSTTPDRLTHAPAEAISCPVRDYEAIIDAGFYLGPKDDLGSNAGEQDGPIMAWRDPFIFCETDGRIHLFWSAKKQARMPAVAHATVRADGDGYVLDTLFAPILLPDGDQFTQAEVPKVYHDSKRDIYFMLISSCNRLYEGQSDDEVTKEQRLYKSHSLDGPWVKYNRDSSILPGLDNLFGASILTANFDSGNLSIIAPYTEMASSERQLTFASVQTINIFNSYKEQLIVSKSR